MGVRGRESVMRGGCDGWGMSVGDGCDGWEMSVVGGVRLRGDERGRRGRWMRG